MSGIYQSTKSHMVIHLSMLENSHDGCFHSFVHSNKIGCHTLPLFKIVGHLNKSTGKGYALFSQVYKKLS